MHETATHKMKVLIVGAGKLGVRLAKIMDGEQFEVTLVDSNAKNVARLSEQLDVLVLEGNGVDVTFLKEIKVHQFDLVLACTDSDEMNIVMCDFVKKLGGKKTIARVRDVEYSNQMEFLKDKLGIDLIINPDLAAAEAIKKYLLRDMTYYLGEFAQGQVKIVDYNIRTNAAFVQQRIMDLKGFDDLLIIAIDRESELLIPDGSIVLEPYDTIYLLGAIETVEHFATKYKLNGTQKAVENVMIVGGGNIGMYLASLLAQAKVNVTLIEQNQRRILALSELLDKVLIIAGDGSDINLLEQERLDAMQALVTVTGLDELNLLVAIIAKRQGVSKTIAKISRDNYSKIINDLPIDAAINPIDITSSELIKYVRGDRVQSISLLLNQEGEVSEVIATAAMNFLNKPLSEVKLPKGILIGAIISGNKVSIASGKSVIRENDRLIVFTHSSKIGEFRKLFLKQKGGLFGEVWNR